MKSSNDWLEYPPFTVGGLGTHCYGLTRSLCNMGVKVDFYMPQTKHGATSDNRNLVIKEVGETTVFLMIVLKAAKLLVSFLKLFLVIIH